MNLRQKLFAAGAVAVLGTVAPQAFAEEHEGGGKNGCEPEILSSSVQPTPPNVTAVSGVCLDLVDAVSTKGKPTTIAVKVEAWLDGAFVPLSMPPVGGKGYTKNATTNVLETIVLCSATDRGDGITTVRITRPYLSEGKAKSKTAESLAAVAFNAGCVPI